jgi:hypothetical protein
VEPAQKNSVGKTVAGVALVGLGLLGLASSLCGGAFTLITLIDTLRGHQGVEGRAWSGVFLVTGGLSLLFGLGALVLSVVVWQRVFRRR